MSDDGLLLSALNNARWTMKPCGVLENQHALLPVPLNTGVMLIHPSEPHTVPFKNANSKANKKQKLVFENSDSENEKEEDVGPKKNEEQEKVDNKESTELQDDGSDSETTIDKEGSETTKKVGFVKYQRRRNQALKNKTSNFDLILDTTVLSCSLDCDNYRIKSIDWYRWFLKELPSNAEDPTYNPPKVCIEEFGRVPKKMFKPLTIQEDFNEYNIPSGKRKRKTMREIPQRLWIKVTLENEGLFSLCLLQYFCIVVF